MLLIRKELCNVNGGVPLTAGPLKVKSKRARPLSPPLCSAKSNTASPLRKAAQPRLTLPISKNSLYTSEATNHTQHPGQLLRTTGRKTSHSSAAFLPHPLAAPGRGRRATPGRDVTAPGTSGGGRVVSRNAAGAGQGEREILARFASSPARLPAPSRPLSESPRQSLASRSRTAGAGGAARGGFPGSVGVSGWSQRPGRTGRSHPPRERPGVGKSPSRRAGDGPPAAAASAEELPPPPPLPQGLRRRDCAERRGRMAAPPRSA